MSDIPVSVATQAQTSARWRSRSSPVLPSWLPEAIGALVVAVLLLVLVVFAADRVGSVGLIAVPAGAMTAGLLLLSPRLELTAGILLLYLGLLDGYLKLRASPGSPAAAGRDVLLYAIVAGMLLRAAVQKMPLVLPRYAVHVIALVAVVLTQGLNPDTSGLRGAFGGYRQHLEFVPLFVVGYVAFRSERSLRCLLIGLAFAAMANAVVAVIQYTLTPEQLAAWGPGYAERVLGTGAFQGGARVFASANGSIHVRPLGLGSDLGASGQFGYLAIPGVLGLMASATRQRWRLLAALALAGCVVGVVASQSRSAALLAIFAGLFTVVITVTPQTAWRTIATVLTTAAVVLVALTQFVDHNDDNTFDRFRTIAPGSLQSTIGADRGGSISLVGSYVAKYPMGHGIGRVGPAASFNRGSTPDTNSETEFNFLITEIGALGAATFLVLWLRVLWDGSRLVRRARTNEQRYLLAAPAAMIAVLTIGWFIGPVTATSPPAPLFWLSAGLIAYRLGPGRSAWSAASTGH